MIVTELKCSLCGGILSFYPDKEGGELKHPGMIRCDNPCDPQCHENPFGHGDNAKEAHSTLCQKFRKQ